MNFSYRQIGICVMFATSLLCLSGCEDAQHSLHEIDHEVPAHWPTSLADNADKIASRIESIPSSSNANILIAELEDLVEWSPEIAADTDLTESQWEPIFAASENLRSQFPLKADTFELMRPELTSFCELLVTSHEIAESQTIAVKQDDAVQARPAANLEVEN